MKYLPMLVVSAVVLASTTAESQQKGPYGWIVPAMQEAGRQVFEIHCSVCHSPRAGGQQFGPNLAGLVGRRAGSLPGFPYSDALKNSGLVWTDDNLMKWIANNTQMVPGTLMPHPEITDPVEKAYLVAYLKTLKPHS
jgi:cytochrome c